LLSVFFSLMWSNPTAAAGVHALFDLTATTTGPFPSDWFTVPDRSQNTRRHVNLPLPDCAVHASDCQDLSVINTLDGFNVQPRLSIPFDGPIDVRTVTSSTVFLFRLANRRDNDNDHHDCVQDGDDNDGCDKAGRLIGINQIVWDTLTNTLHVQSDELLGQHTRYALIVTRGVLDSGGDPVEATDAFRRFRHGVQGEYKRALLDALHTVRRAGLRERDVVTASVFTTQSVTAILEKIRDEINAATPSPADFLLGPGNARTVFRRDAVASITFNRQTLVQGPLDPVPVPLSLLDIFPGAVDIIAFGKYESLDYEVHPGEYIPQVGTRSGTPVVQAVNDIYFNLFLPSGPVPAEGWPVAIFGHGGSFNKNVDLLKVVAQMAQHGIATIGINSVGHGFGPLGTLTVTNTSGDSVTLPAGGRGRDQDNDGAIDSQEGMGAAPLTNIIGVRDGFRQTAIDLMQLVRVIGQGVDVDGDFVQDLDPSRIYYFGQSQGGSYGTLLLAIEPDVKVGALNTAGSLDVDFRRLSPPGRPLLGTVLQSRVPPLINIPGINMYGGVSVNPPLFNDNMPLRDGIPLPVRLTDGSTYDIQSPFTNDVAAAMEIQKLLDESGWASQSGNAPAYASYLRKAPLSGVTAKSVIIQFGKGDKTVPNPVETAVVRAGDLADRTTFFRNDLAFAEDPQLPKNPHAFMISTDIPAARSIALAAQEQIARFFVSDGEEVIHPDPERFFEVPIVLPLPEALSYIP
jgi:hypothetical protein